MIPNLPRELLWTDKTDISEFMSNKLGNDVISGFSFAKSHITTVLDAKTMLKLYNEAFYLSTRLVYEKDAEAHPETYMEKIIDDIGNKELSEHVILIMFMVILLQSNKSNEVLQFANKLQKIYLPQTPFWLLRCVNKVFKPKIKGVDFMLKPCPYPVDELKGIDWKRITQGFSKQVIIDILDLWDSENEKGKVIRQIEQYYISCPLEFKEDKLSEKADEEFFTKQKNLYIVTNEKINVNASKGGRPEGKSLDELFTETCSPAQRDRLIEVIKSLKGKEAAFALRVAASKDVGVIKQVPSYSKALKSFPNIGASSGYHKYKDEKIQMKENEIEYYKRLLIP